jgi:hypothetical protein
MADKVLTGQQNRVKTEADANMANAHAVVFKQEAVSKALNSATSFLSQVKDPQGAAAYINGFYSDPVLGPMASRLAPIDQALKSIPTDPAAFNQWKLEHSNIDPQKFIEMTAPKVEFKDSGQKLVPVNMNPLSQGYTVPTAIQKAATPDAMLSSETTRRGQNMTDSRAREANNLTREGNQTQIVVDPTRGPILINKQTGVARNAVGADGKPIQGEVSAKREASAKNLMTVLDEADNLIGKATGSYLGAGVDQAARVFGGATGGDKAIAQLKVLEGNLMMNQPRMEGPQSDKDVLLYRQNAGQIGDPTVPNSIKKAALKEIRKITEKYAGVAPAADDIHAQADAILRGGK